MNDLTGEPPAVPLLGTVCVELPSGFSIYLGLLKYSPFLDGLCHLPFMERSPSWPLLTSRGSEATYSQQLNPSTLLSLL
jgi:hypothetical protein